MSVSQISFNAKVPRNTSVGFRVKGPTKPVFVAVQYWPDEPACFMSWKCPTYKAYEFAEYQIARRTIRETSLHDEAGRNALWALNQLEGVTYAPEVVPNLDGSFSFEWKTDRGFGSLKIGADYSTYQVCPQTSDPLLGGGAEPFEPYIGILMNTLLYPRMAPSMAICGHLVSDCVIATEPRTAATEKLNSQLTQAFASARLLDFEDGRENEFTLEIARLVKQNGIPAVEEIGRIITQPRVSRDISAQALLCLGRMEDRGTYPARSQAARQGLRSSSALMRDAATVAIDSMADRDAKAELRIAIERESVPSVRKDMESVLAYLETAP